MTNTKDILIRLGNGESIASICAAAGWSQPQFDRWWQDECRRRLPAEKVAKVRGVTGGVEIRRDDWGIPHVYAPSDADVFFGWGYATAQDRLFQLDYFRRKALGRLAEVLGPSGLESDVLYRTIGLGHIAREEWESLPTETRTLLEHYTSGINAFIESCRDRLPIEFDLLDYRPEAWSPVDSLAIAGEFRWYLTGRFPVIVIPELAKRALGSDALYKAFLLGEEDDESIMPRGSYVPGRTGQASGCSSGGGEAGGSNNWVLTGKRTVSGKPVLASDPHVPLAAVSIWQEVRLQGGSFNVAGIAYVGFPGVMIGRNERVAWGITNNICSLRELYRERTDPGHPDCFLFDGKWEPGRERQETIKIKGQADVTKTIRLSRNGPIVDEILPPAGRATGPVSLRWLGAEPCGWVTALIGMNRARNVAEFREATRPWQVPTFNLVFADVDGHIGHQCVGRIPLRASWERGYRPGWDPAQQWQGVIPFEGMPHQMDPPRGFAVTANNRLAPEDYPYPLSCTSGSGHRARRIRERIEAQPRMKPEDCQKLQLDTRSGRAAQCTSPLVKLLANDKDTRIQQAVRSLSDWDFRMEPESVAAALFNVFFAHWCRRVAAERFPAAQVELVSGNAGGLANRLLADDPFGWFAKSDRVQAIRESFSAGLEELTRRLGPDMERWNWGRLHILLQKHFLSDRGDLGKLLDRSGLPTRGDGITVCSSTQDANHAAWLGASYRMVTDLDDPKKGIWAIHVSGSSGQPGSPHYEDQRAPWNRGEYHYIELD